MKNELQNMNVGATKNINGYAVTRWSQDKWEVGTWGKKTTTLAQTLKALTSATGLETSL